MITFTPPEPVSFTHTAAKSVAEMIRRSKFSEPVH